MAKGRHQDGEMEQRRRQASAVMLGNNLVADVVFPFADLAQSADSIEAVEDDLIARLNRFNVDNFILCQAVDRNRKPTAAIMCGRSLPEWRSHYIESRLGEKDDLLQAGLRSREPITWNGFQTTRDVSPGMKDVFDAATDHSLKDGFYLPIHQTDGSIFAVAMLSHGGIDRDGRVNAALHMLGIYYSLAVQRLTSSGPNFMLPGERRPQLTRRQSECLQWVRAGKTDWEISQILGISEHTVIEHLEEARKRLNVRTRTQAVINAIHFGLIQV